MLRFLRRASSLRVLRLFVLMLLAASSVHAQSIETGEDGFRLRSADGQFVLRLRGMAMIDGQFFGGEAAPVGRGFYVRRARLTAQGTLAKRFGFRVRADFGQGDARLVDAYGEARLAPAVRLRVGRHKVPVGLEWLQSASNLFFAERAYPSSLVPHRDVGVQVRGQLAGGRLRYAAGLYNGARDGGSLNADIDRSKEAALRLFARPFRSREGPLRGLGLGVGVSTGRVEGTASEAGLPAYDTPGRQAFFRYRGGSSAAPVTADGARRRVAPQAYYFYGPAGLIGEYTVSAQDVRAGEAAERLVNRAWQAVASVVLTGEAATYERLQPARPYDPAEGGWGAIELVGRVHGLRVDPAAFPRFADPQASAQRALSGGVGVNWHLTVNVRLVLGYEQTRFDGAAGLAAPMETEHLILTRAQVAF